MIVAPENAVALITVPYSDEGLIPLIITRRTVKRRRTDVEKGWFSYVCLFKGNKFEITFFSAYFGLVIIINIYQFNIYNKKTQTTFWSIYNYNRFFRYSDNLKYKFIFVTRFQILFCQRNVMFLWIKQY